MLSSLFFIDGVAQLIQSFHSPTTMFIQNRVCKQWEVKSYNNTPVQIEEVTLTLSLIKWAVNGGKRPAYNITDDKRKGTDGPFVVF